MAGAPYLAGKESGGMERGSGGRESDTEVQTARRTRRPSQLIRDVQKAEHKRPRMFMV